MNSTALETTDIRRLYTMTSEEVDPFEFYDLDRVEPFQRHVATPRPWVANEEAEAWKVDWNEEPLVVAARCSETSASQKLRVKQSDFISALAEVQRHCSAAKAAIRAEIVSQWVESVDNRLTAFSEFTNALSVATHTLSVRNEEVSKAILEPLDETRRIATLLNRYAFATASSRIPTEHSEKARVVQRFEGKLLRICEHEARVSLVDEDGREAFADCDAEEFTSRGIAEGDTFTYVIRQLNGTLTTSILPSPRVGLTPEDVSAIRDEISRDLADLEVTDEH